MKKSLLFAASAACCLAMLFTAVPASAQNMAGGQAATVAHRQPTAPLNGIALLDMAFLYKNLNRIKAQREEMKTDFQRVEADLKRERETLQSLVEQLKGFKPGTPDYKRMEEDIVQRDANLQIQMKMTQREFGEREAKLWHAVYQEILQEVDYIAKANSISVVLQFDGEPLKKDEPRDVLRNIQKPVIWYSSGLDITGQVLHRLNSRAGTPTHMPAANARTAPGGAPGAGRMGIPMQNVPARR